jgi:hypothetical protein
MTTVISRIGVERHVVAARKIVFIRGIMGNVHINVDPSICVLFPTKKG